MHVCMHVLEQKTLFQTKAHNILHVRGIYTQKNVYQRVSLYVINTFSSFPRVVLNMKTAYIQEYQYSFNCFAQS